MRRKKRNWLRYNKLYNWATGWFNCWHPNENSFSYFFYQKYFRLSQHRKVSFYLMFTNTTAVSSTAYQITTDCAIFPFIAESMKFGYEKKALISRKFLLLLLGYQEKLFIVKLSSLFASTSDNCFSSYQSWSDAYLKAENWDFLFVIHPAFSWIHNKSIIGPYFLTYRNYFLLCLNQWNSSRDQK